MTTLQQTAFIQMLKVITLSRIIDEKNNAIRNKEYAQAAKLLAKEREIRATLMPLEQLYSLNDELDALLKLDE